MGLDRVGGEGGDCVGLVGVEAGEVEHCVWKRG